MREIRRELRQLPRDRRKDIVSSIRAGEAVADPRDAALAIAWAEHLTAKRHGWWWPRWAMPRKRPHGWRAWVWLLHLAWIAAAVAYAWTMLWPALPGIWRWVIVGFVVYSTIATPITMRQVLRAYWNAPQAAEKNRQRIATRQIE
jgi:hypothetical protein